MIGNNLFMATTSLKLISFNSMEFGIKNIFGRECIVMATNLHPLYDMKKSSRKTTVPSR